MNHTDKLAYLNDLYTKGRSGLSTPSGKAVVEWFEGLQDLNKVKTIDLLTMLAHAMDSLESAYEAGIEI